MRAANSPADAETFTVHLLDMGREMYGDCLLCRMGSVTVLVDGGHPADYRSRGGCPSLPDQLGKLLGHGPPYVISLLVVTHAHSDHIGCLPMMIEHGDLRAEYALVADEKFGFGRAIDDADASSRKAVSPAVRRIATALREDSHSAMSDADLREFLEDAEKLEQRYSKMLETLVGRGTIVLRHGRDDVSELEKAFRKVGLKVLGPTTEQLLLCAEFLAGARDAIHDTIGDRFARDATANELAVYRAIAGPVRRRDAYTSSEDQPGPGAAVNNESIVLRFEFGGRKVLLTGDMQFAKPEVPHLDQHVAALRCVIADDGPFDLVKLPHHASYNGFDESVYEEWNGSRLFVMAGGSDDAGHPDPGVLELLEAHRDEIQWARTDRNGPVTVDLGPGGEGVRISRGRLNDPTPNLRDVQPVASSGPPEHPPAASIAETRIRVAPEATAESCPGVVEVIARVPHVATRVMLTIEVEPRGIAPGTSGPVSVRSRPRPGQAADELRVGGGRTLPSLLFVTSRGALVENIGRAETAQVLEAIVAGGHVLLDDLPAGLIDPAVAIDKVRRKLRAGTGRGYAGVVLLGGYDVIPPQRLDVLDPALRRAISGSGFTDSDDFLVWCDEAYGDLDEDQIADLPVSRIPDGKSSALVFAALQATNVPASSKFAVRNVARPFAESIAEKIPGVGDLLVSEPASSRDIPMAALGRDAVYFMLHGSETDATRFWGERNGWSLEAVNVGNVPSRCISVVFTGCCWGGLTANTSAYHAPPGQVAASRTPEASMALSFLKAGAIAFIGCTGSHYSPTEPPYNYFGGPMHEAFWEAYKESLLPAQSLWKARRTYLQGIPHGQGADTSQAIERKILWQYACLGLGW